jgi:hypothetical protein
MWLHPLISSMFADTKGEFWLRRRILRLPIKRLGTWNTLLLTQLAALQRWRHKFPPVVSRPCRGIQILTILDCWKWSQCHQKCLDDTEKILKVMLVDFEYGGIELFDGSMCVYLLLRRHNSSKDRLRSYIVRFPWNTISVVKSPVFDDCSETRVVGSSRTKLCDGADHAGT